MTPKQANESIIKKLEISETLSERRISDSMMIELYAQNTCKIGEYRETRVKHSLKLANTFYLTACSLQLARRLRSHYIHYPTYSDPPGETSSGKRIGVFYLNDKSVFKKCREWRLSQPVGSVTTLYLATTINTDILIRTDIKKFRLKLLKGG